MMVVITYDVKTESEDGKARLRKVAKTCKDYGQRVQFSVFECLVDPARFKLLQAKLEAIMDKEKDSIRYYKLGDEWKTRIEHVGAKAVIDLEGTLMA